MASTAPTTPSSQSMPYLGRVEVEVAEVEVEEAELEEEVEVEVEEAEGAEEVEEAEVVGRGGQAAYGEGLPTSPSAGSTVRCAMSRSPHTRHWLGSGLGLGLGLGLRSG